MSGHGDRAARRAGAGLVLLTLMVAVFAFTWLAGGGEPPCGWGIFHP